MTMRPSALIADDEPLLRTALASLLAELWPALDIVAEARNGRDAKYTVVAWRGDDGQLAEAVIRTALKELIGQLDPVHFVQIHRSYVVNLRSVSHVKRGEAETANIHLKGRREVLPVSRSYLNLFRQM